MYSTQTIFAVISCALGALMLLVARHQKLNHDIGKVPLISWMAKHVIGLLLLIISVTAFQALLMDQEMPS